MQTVPAKSRTAMAIGAVLLVAVIGAVALWSGSRPKDMPEDMSGMLPEEMSGAPVTSPGSTTGTAPTAPTNAAGQAAPGSQATLVPEEYEVMAGDTLSDISRKFYGDHIYAGDIEALNQMETPDRLMVGQKLKMPRMESLKPVATP